MLRHASPCLGVLAVGWADAALSLTLATLSASSAASLCAHFGGDGSPLARISLASRSHLARISLASRSPDTAGARYGGDDADEDGRLARHAAEEARRPRAARSRRAKSRGRGTGARPGGSGGRGRAEEAAERAERKGLRALRAGLAGGARPRGERRDRCVGGGRQRPRLRHPTVSGAPAAESVGDETCPHGSCGDKGALTGHVQRDGHRRPAGKGDAGDRARARP
eukprot:6294801-Prymnesium_polylepis.1